MNDNNLLNSLMKRLEKSVSILKLAASDNMTSVTTTDGDTLSIDGEISIGASVYTTDENGNITPAEDADYTLDNGTIITVSNGAISSISGDPEATQEDTASPETELADAATAPTDAPATDGASTTVDADPNTESRLEALETAMAQVIEALSASTTCNEQLTNENTKLKDKVEKLSKEPATASIKTKIIGLNANTQNDELDAIRKLVKSNQS
jgi:transcriptional regulator with GAF, ATPase, and Fis domain